MDTHSLILSFAVENIQWTLPTAETQRTLIQACIWLHNGQLTFLVVGSVHGSVGTRWSLRTCALRLLLLNKRLERSQLRGLLDEKFISLHLWIMKKEFLVFL